MTEISQESVTIKLSFLVDAWYAVLLLINRGYKMADIINKNMDKLTIFDDVIDSLSSVLKIYGESSNRYDCPYYYTERSNVGALSTAAIMTRSWISIEEFSIRRKRAGSGRCDLYLKRIDSNDGGFVIEAKKVETKSANRINQKLGEACDQVKKISKSDAGDATRLGVVFVVPPIPIKSVSDDYIEKMISRMEKDCWCDLSAHLYLDCFRDLTGTGIYKEKCYPGLSIFAKAP